MHRRVACLFLLLCLGCQTAFPPAAPVRHSAPPPATASSATPGKSDKTQDKQPIDNRHLALAALYLEQGEDDKACWHLGLVVEQEPDHRSARFFYAEALDRLSRHEEAREQFEQVIARLQEANALDLRHLIHCHGRLVDIAEKEESDYLRHLHRGIALFWLAQTPVGKPDEDLVSAEGLLCKAAAALAEARQLEPREARPCWYLYKAWRHLGQQRQAQRHLQLAKDLAPFSELTAAEQRGLFLACAEE